MTDRDKINPSYGRFSIPFQACNLILPPSEPTLNNYTAIHDLEGGGLGCMWVGGTLIINNNNKALCFVRMRWDETSACKCSEDGNPPLMTSLALHCQ